MKNENGFATSGILYTLLLLFVALLFGVLQNLQNKKTILDTLKTETINALACDCTKMSEDIQTISDSLKWIPNYDQMQEMFGNTIRITFTAPDNGLLLLSCNAGTSWNEHWAYIILNGKVAAGIGNSYAVHNSITIPVSKGTEVRCQRDSVQANSKCIFIPYMKSTS